MNQLPKSIYDAHGGLNLWEQITQIQTEISGGGLALAIKLRQPCYSNLKVAFFKKSNHVEIILNKKKNKIGIYKNGKSSIIKNGQEVEQKLNVGDNPKKTRAFWRDCDQMYFRGYAFLNYFSTPFFFLDKEFLISEIGNWKEGKENWKMFKVIFPDKIITHSKEQTFYFDENNLLRRLDYTVELYGKWAKVAQYCFGHSNFDGYVFPTKRRMYKLFKNNKPFRFPMIWLNYKYINIIC